MITAPDGRVALELIERVAPDVVVTDLQMPELDGLELIRRLRADERWKAVPVLVFTAYSSNDARLMAAAVMPNVTVKTKGESVRGMGELLRSLIQRSALDLDASAERDRRHEIERALAVITDPDRRLPGEVDTAPPDEAQRWYRTYQDLVRFNLEAIAAMVQQQGAVDPATQPEADLDLLVLEAEGERLQRRAEYWRARCESSTDGD